MSIEKIYDIETGETTEVTLTKEAAASLAKEQAKIDAELQLIQEKRQAKEAVLAKLGLTVEEATALLA